MPSRLDERRSKLGRRAHTLAPREHCVSVSGVTGYSKPLRSALAYTLFIRANSNIAWVHNADVSTRPGEAPSIAFLGPGYSGDQMGTSLEVIKYGKADQALVTSLKLRRPLREMCERYRTMDWHETSRSALAGSTVEG